MQVNEWGPAGWKFLHTVTFNYTPTEENKKKYKEFFSTLAEARKREAEIKKWRREKKMELISIKVIQ